MRRGLWLPPTKIQIDYILLLDPIFKFLLDSEFIKIG